MRLKQMDVRLGLMCTGGHSTFVGALKGCHLRTLLLLCLFPASWKLCAEG